jgi:nicotinamidase-related amidase
MAVKKDYSDMKRALLVIDMQRVYAPGGAWQTPGFEKAAANITKLCPLFEHRLFTRHLPFPDPPGRWQNYNAAFASINADQEAALLIPDLDRFEYLDFPKYTYSALASGELKSFLLTEDFAEILLTGVQTEFCVTATLLQAVDLGLPVTLVPDACAGDLPVFEAALIALVRRMPCQVQLKYTEELLHG